MANTPIRRRFSVLTEILDKAGGKQTLSTPALLTSAEKPAGNTNRYNIVSALDWDDVYLDENSTEYHWLQSMFSQPNRPKSAVVIHDSVTESVTDALNDAVKLGAEFYWLHDACNDTGLTVEDGTVTNLTALVDEQLSLPGQSAKVTTVEIVASVDGTQSTLSEDGLEFIVVQDAG